MTLTKPVIIKGISEKIGITKQEAGEIVETFLEIIRRTLASGEDIQISRFGKFYVQSKKERRGRNPATGDDLILAPRKIVRFRCSPKLRHRVNDR